jgi:ppGpp synthetase/RelA/SpoT-type nucleotidyltranferase
MKSVTIAIKIPASILEKLRLKAGKFTDGNLSAWLRLAGVRYSPRLNKN